MEVALSFLLPAQIPQQLQRVCLALVPHLLGSGFSFFFFGLIRPLYSPWFLLCGMCVCVHACVCVCVCVSK